MALFTCAESVKGALGRLYAMNECVIFWNEDRTFKLMLRNDPDTPENDEVAFELVLIVDDDDEGMARMLELLGASEDEPGVHVLHQWMFEELTVERAADVMAKLNGAYLMKLCPCGEALIKDDADVCCLCHMKLDEENGTKHFCAICHSDGRELHMIRRPCGHMFHKRCSVKWCSMSDGWCPLCKRM